MLGLKLRDEFLGSQMPGTAIELSRNDKQGAIQKSPEQILSITFPTSDVQLALTALSKDRPALPIVLVGERGRGKSHIMAVMHHAINSPDSVQPWVDEWGKKLDSHRLQNSTLEHRFLAITEALHNNEYNFLWDLLFERHPNGKYYQGQFDSSGLAAPSRSLIEKMLEEQPICLILDEFQTWYSSLPETDKSGNLKIRQSAFSFIQMLAEIAKERPDLLILVVSTLNTDNEAYQQIHRVGEVKISFQGATAKVDRQHLILHRLFQNHAHILKEDIKKLAQVYTSERSRLLFSGKNDSELREREEEVAACWPFSPELLNLLEDHILMASQAQNTRDLIRILAQLYKNNGGNVPVLTPADFYVDGDYGAAHELIRSAASDDKLLDIANRNLQMLKNTGLNISSMREMISAIWMYSMMIDITKGLSKNLLQLLITRNVPIEDNSFNEDLDKLIENSINIHGGENNAQNLHFQLNENPRSKVKNFARNENLWSGTSESSSMHYPLKDIEHIRKTLKSILSPDNKEAKSKIIVLGPEWQNNPWDELDKDDHPDKWTKPVLLVIPDALSSNKSELNKILGTWLKNNVSTRRNTVRFLLARDDSNKLYHDKDLKFYARASYLCSKEAWGKSPDRIYSDLHNEFDAPLRKLLKERYNRFAIIQEWDYQNPENCVFNIEKLGGAAEDFPKKIEEIIASDIFDPNEFASFVKSYAEKDQLAGRLLDDLLEPAPKGKSCIPYQGEYPIFEKLVNLAAQGELALNVAGAWLKRSNDDISDEDAKKRIMSKAYRSTNENRLVQLSLPSSAVIADPTPGRQKSEHENDDKSDAEEQSRKDGQGQDTPDPYSINGQNTEKPDNGTNEPAFTTYAHQSDNAERSINLIKSFEKWGINNSQQLESARIEFNDLSAQQIKNILLIIPSTYMAKLSVTYKK